MRVGYLRQQRCQLWRGLRLHMRNGQRRPRTVLAHQRGQVPDAHLNARIKGFDRVRARQQQQRSAAGRKCGGCKRQQARGLCVGNQQ